MKRVHCEDYGLDMEDLRDRYPDVLLADGFESALLGVAYNIGIEPVAVYSTQLCIAILMMQGMTNEEAMEYFDFNVVGAYMGPKTPLFLTQLHGTEIGTGVFHSHDGKEIQGGFCGCAHRFQLNTEGMNNAIDAHERYVRGDTVFTDTASLESLIK